MTMQAMTSTLQMLLARFEQQQREFQQASACFDVFPSKAGIEFRVICNSNIGSRQRGNNGHARSRVCRKGGKAEMYS